MSEYMPEDMSDRMPEDMSEYMPEDMPDRMPDWMPEDMSDRVPEDMPDRMPEDLPDRMPEDMPEDMPDRMSNRMSEDLSDRMPEDLPVRKCINVMVGITRSKVIGFLRPFCGQNCPVFFFIIFICLCRMWRPRLHSTSGWQLVQQTDTQFQSPSGLSSVETKNTSRRELPVIVATNGRNDQKSINLAKQAIRSVSSEICLLDKKVYQISKRANYFTSSDPHHDIYTFSYWQIFWHSIWHIFWHSIWHSIWHIFWHMIWHIFWHIFWHSIWQIFWHSIWHIFWHSIWHIFWHSIWHSI